MAKKPLILTFGFVLLSGSVAWAQQSATTVVAAQDEKPGAFAFRFKEGGNFLGVQTEQMTRENMSRFNLSGEPRGVSVTSMTENSPAAKAGVQKGDVILRFDGESVTSVAKLQRLISEAAPQHTARLTISRNGAEQELSVTLGKREGLRGQNFENFVFTPGEKFDFDSEEWRKRAEELSRQFEKFPRGEGRSYTIMFGGGRRIGVTTTPLTEQLSAYFGVAGKDGLLITSVAENSPAARAGLKAGDVLTEADGVKLSGVGDLSRQLNRQQEGDVTLTITRDKKARQIRVMPEKAAPDRFTLPAIRSVAPVAALAPLSRVNVRTPRAVVAPRIVAPRVRALPRVKPVLVQPPIL